MQRHLSHGSPSGFDASSSSERPRTLRTRARGELYRLIRLSKYCRPSFRAISIWMKTSWSLPGETSSAPGWERASEPCSRLPQVNSPCYPEANRAQLNPTMAVNKERTRDSAGARRGHTRMSMRCRTTPDPLSKILTPRTEHHSLVTAALNNHRVTVVDAWTLRQAQAPHPGDLSLAKVADTTERLSQAPAVNTRTRPEWARSPRRTRLT